MIITSWQERTLDKGTLCAIALDRLGAAGSFGTALLVDNRADNIGRFRGMGGQGLPFTSDGDFREALAGLRRRLAATPSGSR